MITRNLTLILLLFFTESKIVKAQAPQQIKVDFSDKKNEYKVTVDHEKEFFVTVSNLNRYLYKIEGVKVETDFNVAVPSAFSATKLPSFVTFDIPKTSIAQLPSTSAEKSSQDLLNRIKELQDKISKQSQTYSEALLLQNDLIHLSGDCAPNYGQWKSSLTARVNRFISEYSGITVANTSDLSSQLDDMLLNLAKNAKSNLTELEKLVSAYTAKASKELNDQYKKNVGFIKESKKELQNARLTADERKEIKLG